MPFFQYRFAELIHYPIEKRNFNDVLREAAIKFNDSPYVATMDDGKIVEFFAIL